MTDASPRSAQAVRLIVLLVLAAVWTAVLYWTWTEGARQSCFEYVPLAEAEASWSCGERRFGGRFLAVLAAGPAAAVALWFSLRPRRSRKPR
ncbi:hypothetical protein AB0A73_03910 [Glycomyces sp. NPDC047369]